MRPLPIRCLVVLLWPALAWSQAHEHGVADLELALFDGQVDVQLRVPAGDAYGFERAPRDAAEQAQVAAIHQRLTAADRWITRSDGSSCMLEDTRIDAPAKPAAAAAPDPVHAHDHAHHDDHAPAHDTHTAGAPTAGEAHLDLTLSARLQCGTAPLTGLRVDVFAVLPELQRVRYQSVWDSGQGAGELRPTQIELRFQSP